ncbi:DUF411 domain-containing protein [Kaistia defluvii]|uniref:DUF411 domain-containing protein n=1 Tax=Kaistia defluvii TaxID=410841 RepID=UPI00224E9CDD|nr:DUF411 domain-containing protein [Kaistia defluvii]MCX5517759.1 DUF411 domain-containing protein [Kaistia defluvii]
MKDPGCGCCSAWVEILRADGFEVGGGEERQATLPARYKRDSGIPLQMASCHTARIQGYGIEGHVPAADIRRLLAERPDAVGLSVPGMPYGSPGMGAEPQREAYDGFLIRRNGGTSDFSHYAAA